MTMKEVKELPTGYLAFFIFALIKPILGLCVLIQGIIMISYSPPACEEFGKCPVFEKFYCEGVDGGDPFHKTLDEVPANYGICGLALGFGTMATGVCSYLAAQKKQKRYSCTQMIFNILICITSAILSLFCLGEASNLEESCEALKALEPLLKAFGLGCDALGT